MTLPLPPSDPGAIRRVAFLGTPEIAVSTLVAIHEAGFEIPLVVSGADKRRGRGRATTPTPVKSAALSRGLRVTAEPDDLLDEHAGEPIDLAVVVAFGRILGRHLLEQIPMVNIHFSALPRWRGAAPVERAILAGDTSTAIAIMSVVERLDEGDIWAQKEVAITENDTLVDLWSQMSVDGAGLLIQTLRSGFANATPQVGEPVYARKLHAPELELNWNTPASTLHRQVRVGDAWTTYDGQRFKVHRAEVVDADLAPGLIHDLVVGTSDRGLRLICVQPAGKPRMEASAWANGAQPDGTRFGVDVFDEH